MREILVSLKDVTIRYPDASSFPNINFEVKRGEHIALVGENEPLKNAILDALAGKAGIIKGKAFFDTSNSNAESGEVVITSHRKRIAHVSSRHQFKDLTNTSQFYYQQRFNSIDSENSLTVKQYLAKIHAVIIGEWTIEKTIDTLKLDSLLHEQLIKLSNGETKRVLIAAALLSNPRLLLLSSPLTGLDIHSRRDITNLINQIASSEITVVMSTASKEIPGSINNVAVIQGDNSINILDKNSFRPSRQQINREPMDKNELNKLISTGPFGAFDKIVEMKNVTIKYGDKLILNNVNWTIKQGERWALLGHNGAGKSTLLSLINGDNPQAFANQIVLFDRKKGSGESIWDIKKKIGFFSSELYQYFPVETSCLQAVESGFYDTIGLFRPENPQMSTIALKWMKLLGVEHLSRKLLKNVSAVEQRLCLLVRALVKNPPLLILDEPCQEFIEQQLTNFKTLIDSICQNTNVTLIYVSHYAEDIPESVTKVLRLSNGLVMDENV